MYMSACGHAFARNPFSSVANRLIKPFHMCMRDMSTSFGNLATKILHEGKFILTAWNITEM